MKMNKISDEIINFILKAMKNWKDEWITGGQNLREVKIQKTIFQGNSLLPLLFIIAAMQLNYMH